MARSDATSPYFAAIDWGSGGSASLALRIIEQPARSDAARQRTADVEVNRNGLFNRACMQAVGTTVARSRIVARSTRMRPAPRVPGQGRNNRASGNTTRGLLSIGATAIIAPRYVARTARPPSPDVAPSIAIPFGEIMFRQCCVITALGFLVPLSAAAETRCEHALKALGADLADAQCVESADLTTNNPDTTPADNSLPGLPRFAFTPQTDRNTIAPSAGHRTPITKAVPGLQINARIAADPLGQGRFLLRLPDDWNGKLVVAGASGTRSEFNGDFAWSDYVVQKGYAYASQNKGMLNLLLSARQRDPLGCRLNPASPRVRAFLRQRSRASHSPAGPST